MERPIVSIIIPVYNVETYLDRAVDSICGQSLTNWEMFLVDDGSTDGSGALCDRLAEDDERIQVIHQENQGAAAARNAAIDKATGKYLYFMDADDWASVDMLYEMVCLAENYKLDAWAGKPMNNACRKLDSIGKKLEGPQEMTASEPEEQCAQLVVAAFYIETYYNETDYYIQKQSVPSCVYASKAEFRDHAHELFDRNLLYTPWNKLYLTSYIQENNVRFPNVHWDDFPFNLDVIRNIERVTVTDNAYYHFIRKRVDSESEKYNPSLYDKREEENGWMIGLYDGWRCEVQHQLIEEMKKNQPALTVLENENAAEEAAAWQETAKKAEEEGSCEQQADPQAAGEAFQKGENQPVSEEKASQNPGESGTENEVSQEEDTLGQKSGEQTLTDDAESATDDAEPAEDGNLNFNFLDKNASEVPIVNIPSPEANEFIARRYLERIVGCVENITNPACEMTKKEKRAEIKRIVSQESVRSALKVARPRSSYMKTILLPIKMKSVSLTYLEGTLISKVKAKNTRLFAHLKAHR